MIQASDTFIPCETVSCALCGGAESKLFASGYDYQYRTSGQPYAFVQCLDCGHVYLNPRPVKEAISRTYPEQYYTRSGRHTGSSSFLIASFKRRVIRRRMAPFRDILEGPRRVLEIGSGDGALLLDLKGRYPHIELTGIDISFPATAKSRCGEQGIRLIESRIEDVDLPPETYDLAVMHQLLEHLPDPVAAIDRIARSLKPGAGISIETPDLDGYDRRLFAKSAWGGYYFPRHLHLFSRDTITRLLEANGFEDVRHASLTASLIWTFSMHARLSPWPGKGRARSAVSRIFTDRNPLVLAVFTLADLAALGMGKRTSNMKIIARKKPAVTFGYKHEGGE